jgi:hypothetical protein
MKVNNNTDFHWRNVLKPTPPNIFFVITTLEGVVMLFNGEQIISKAPPTVVIILLVVQTIMGKLVLFFGRIKDEWEKTKRVTVESTGKMTVTEEVIDNPAVPSE